MHGLFLISNAWEITILLQIEFCLNTIEGSLYTNLMFINTNNKIVN